MGFNLLLGFTLRSHSTSCWNCGKQRSSLVEAFEVFFFRNTVGDNARSSLQ
jgi:hypothetical protein